MAVDFFHRLVASGPPHEVGVFRRAVGRTVSRKRVAGVRGWRERVPLSFTAMYTVCPELTRIEPEPPFDPYELSVWPTVSLPDGRAAVRYQFQTRNLEMQDFLALLSPTFADLDFILVTMCLDDGDIDSYWIHNGRTRKYALPAKRIEWHWEKAGKRFGIAGEDLYDDDEARSFAEDGMLDEASNYWERRVAAAHAKSAGVRTTKRPAKPVRVAAVHSSGAATGGSRKPDWRNQPKVRELEFEKAVVMAQLSESLAASRKAATGKKRGHHAK